MFFILVLILSLPLCSPMVEFSEADAEVNEVDLNLTTAIERALQNHPQISASEKGLEEAKGFFGKLDCVRIPQLSLAVEPQPFLANPVIKNGELNTFKLLS
jgi:hypothetical protein